MSSLEFGWCVVSAVRVRILLKNSECRGERLRKNGLQRMQKELNRFGKQNLVQKGNNGSFILFFHRMTLTMDVLFCKQLLIHLHAQQRIAQP